MSNIQFGTNKTKKRINNKIFCNSYSKPYQHQVFLRNGSGVMSSTRYAEKKQNENKLNLFGCRWYFQLCIKRIRRTKQDEKQNCRRKYERKKRQSKNCFINKHGLHEIWDRRIPYKQEQQQQPKNPEYIHNTQVRAQVRSMYGIYVQRTYMFYLFSLEALQNGIVEHIWVSVPPGSVRTSSIPWVAGATAGAASPF